MGVDLRMWISVSGAEFTTGRLAARHKNPDFRLKYVAPHVAA
jgi:hypothetical protein